jgi:hypothetical protein
MNRSRRVVLSLGLVLAAFVGTFPPWAETITQVPGPDARS